MSTVNNVNNGNCQQWQLLTVSFSVLSNKMKEIGKIIDLSQKQTDEGLCTHVESLVGVPFDIKRAYWIYDVPKGESRGGHAHKRLRQVIIAVKGSFIVNLDDGHQKKQYLLDCPDKGLLIDTKIWRTLDDFSEGAVCLVLASELYDPDDYLYDYNDFREYIHHV